jgi:hypothetical protein
MVAAILCLKRIYDFKEGKSVKIRITGVYPSDSMLLHQHRRMCVMQQVSG